MTIQVTAFSQAPRRTWPRAAVFDCDGLLVDTAACWLSAYRAVALTAGGSLEGADLGPLEGASVPTAAHKVGELLRRPVSPSLLAQALQQAVLAAPIRAMPGAYRVLAALAQALPLAVASNAPADIVHAALLRSGLKRFLPLVFSADQVGLYKPDPAVYVHACRTLGVDPSDAIALEDSAAGAAAARAAGLTVIAVPDRRATRRYADLSVPRLDDPRVFELFGVDGCRAIRRRSSALRPEQSHADVEVDGV